MNNGESPRIPQLVFAVQWNGREWGIHATMNAETADGLGDAFAAMAELVAASGKPGSARLLGTANDAHEAARMARRLNNTVEQRN